MKIYSIGEVCSLLGVKPHMLRYWEKEFPLLKPKRSLAGRRLYREREIQLLFRLSYLLCRKKYSLEGAKRKIWEEIAAEKINFKLNIRQLRGELLELLSRLPSKKRSEIDKPGTDNETGETE